MTVPKTDNAGMNPVFPPGRYGRRREPRSRQNRTVLATGLTVVLLGALLIGVKLYRQFGDPDYQPEVILYHEITDSQIVIQFRVTLPPGKGAVCAVRARSHDGAVVGSAEVPVPAGQTVTRYRLATTAKPFIGEVLRCRPS